MPVKCSQCGTENLDGALFCDECGASLAQPSVTESPAAPAEASPAAPTEVPAPTPAAPPAVGVVKCPSCHHENPADARFCENCGAALPTAPPTPEVTPQPEAAAPTPAAPIAALALEGGLELPLDFSKGEVLIGRADPVSRVFPDVDLTPHGGYDAGVSRRHCRLTFQGGQFFVEDLGSTNGTKLNGQAIPPNQPRPIKDGDILELGVLRLTFKVRQGA
ncbi:MAG: hypothetical protein KEFWMYNX_000026 [Candidatus Fervidibacter sp.]|jgi:FOG: FHA domain